MSKQTVEQVAFEEGRTAAEAGLDMRANTYVGLSGCRVEWERGYAYGLGQTDCMDGLSASDCPFTQDYLKQSYAEGFFSRIATREAWEDACDSGAA